jgi:hypothetical protein
MLYYSGRCVKGHRTSRSFSGISAQVLPNILIKNNASKHPRVLPIDTTPIHINYIAQEGIQRPPDQPEFLGDQCTTFVEIL